MKNPSVKKRIDRLLSILAVLLATAGIVVILYPHAMQWFNALQAQCGYKNLLSTIESNKVVHHQELYNQMQAYNEKIFAEGQSGLADPWAYSQESVNLAEYGFDENIIGYIKIPSIDVLLPIYLGASAENMSKGAAHLGQTSLPIGGKNTNSVICAHRGWSTNKMFDRLVELQVGDEVIITNLWYTMLYRVTETKTITDRDVGVLTIQKGKDMLTLFTCFYQQDRKDRFVVCCERFQIQNS